MGLRPDDDDDDDDMKRGGKNDKEGISYHHLILTCLPTHLPTRGLYR